MARRGKQAKTKAAPAVLGTIDGRPIVGVNVIVRKTGDGLSESVKVDPSVALDIRHGDEGYIVFAWTCVDVHTPVENRADPAEGGVYRIPVLDAGTATFLDDEIVSRAIAAQAKKNQAWREEQAGVSRLPGADLTEDHLAGLHATELVPGCPTCDEEVRLANDEADE